MVVDLVEEERLLEKLRRGVKGKEYEGGVLSRKGRREKERGAGREDEGGRKGLRIGERGGEVTKGPKGEGKGGRSEKEGKKE